MAEKRYYWLKLYDGFFDSLPVKKLRQMAGGDTYTIIYLKMQLKAMKHDGVLRWTGVEENFADELALDLNEEPDNVAITLQYLMSKGLCETSDNIGFFFPYAVQNTGSETASTQRWRDWRDRKAMESNAAPVGDLLESNATPTQRQQIANVEKEIEKEIEIRDRGGRAREALGEVMSFYLDRINTTPSTMVVAEIESFVSVLSAPVVLHAMQIAVDEGKYAWSYIRAILARYQREDLKTLEKVQRSEQEHAQRKKPTGGKVQASNEPSRPATQKDLDKILNSI